MNKKPEYFDIELEATRANGKKVRGVIERGTIHDVFSYVKRCEAFKYRRLTPYEIRDAVVVDTTEVK